MAKPPLQFTRPSRAQEFSKVQSRPARSPEVDLESPQVHAFSLRGKISMLPSRTDRLMNQPTRPSDWRMMPSRRFWNMALPIIHGGTSGSAAPVSGRKLSEIAYFRCSKRTRIVLELLDQPLRELAANYRTGACPILSRVAPELPAPEYRWSYRRIWLKNFSISLRQEAQ